MTVAVTLKTNDGFVLAADRALTIDSPDGKCAERVYYHTRKIFRLYDKVALITCGLSGIGLRTSTAAILKDFNYEMRDSYTVRDIATALLDHVYALYFQEFCMSEVKPRLEYVVAGYCSDGTPQEFRFFMEGSDYGIGDDLYVLGGVVSYGMNEPVVRLLGGYSLKLFKLLLDDASLVPKDKVGPLINKLKESLLAPLLVPEMPLHDACGLARFLVKTTSGFSHFMPGMAQVGGYAQIAVISPQTGFRRIKRKRYRCSAIVEHKRESL